MQENELKVVFLFKRVSSHITGLELLLTFTLIMLFTSLLKILAVLFYLLTAYLDIQFAASINYRAMSDCRRDPVFNECIYMYIVIPSKHEGGGDKSGGKDVGVDIHVGVDIVE